MLDYVYDEKRKKSHVQESSQTLCAKSHCDKKYMSCPQSPRKAGDEPALKKHSPKQSGSTQQLDEETRHKYHMLADKIANYQKILSNTEFLCHPPSQPGAAHESGEQAQNQVQELDPIMHNKKLLQKINRYISRNQDEVQNLLYNYTDFTEKIKQSSQYSYAKSVKPRTK